MDAGGKCLGRQPWHPGIRTSNAGPKCEGHVVNTASVAGLLSMPGMAMYCVSKHSVVTLTECLHHDLMAFGAKIRASVLCPAFVPTGISDSERNRPDALRDVREKSETD